MQQRVGSYAVVGQLVTASSGFAFGQLLSGDAKGAEEELRRLFSPFKIREATTKAPKTNPAVMPTCNHLLKLVSVQVYGTGTNELLYEGTVPKHISTDFANYLKLQQKPTHMIMMFADGSNSSCIARLRDIPVSFGDLTVRMDFPAIEDAPRGVNSGPPALELPRAVIDPAGKFVDLIHEGRTVRVGLEPHRARLLT